MENWARFLPPGQTAQQMRAFAMRFGSTGGHWMGCEPGQVQRTWRAEPLGLLRFSDVTPPLLLGALQNRFAGVGEPAHTEIVQKGRTYWITDRRW